MWTLDERIADLGGGGVAMALLVGLLLGLRHATDPDHLTAVSTLMLGGDDRGARRAARLGAAWGAGHAATLLAFGLPVLAVHRALPGTIQAAAELSIGLVIVALAVRLLVRWRRGYLHIHVHSHGGVVHAHPHVHEHPRAARHPAAHEHAHVEALERTPTAAFAVGLLHGVGGSAGVTVLLIGAIPQRATAVAALLVFALATAMSMGLVSAAFGTALTRRPIAPLLERLTPVVGAASLVFGAFYALSAVGAAA